MGRKKVELIVEISPDGELHVLVEGIKGPACLEYLDAIARRLGRPTEKRLTAEYYQAEDSVIRRVFGKRGS